MPFSRRLLACISQALSVSILIRRCRGLPQETPNDIVRSNGYIIQQCSLFAPHVQEALENLYDVLPLSIWDTHYGTASAPYQAFFKNSYYETLVDHILSSISIGAPLRLDPDNEILEPSLVCALKPDTVIVHEAGQSFDIYDVCRREPTWVILYYPGTSTIFICTAFFLMPAVPAVGNCPTVNDATNQFEGNLGIFLQSQMYMLLHEIAHFYIGATVEMSRNESMDWNYALSLSPEDATHNALNYVLYVASVEKECTEYPRADRAQPSGGRRLGGVLDSLNLSSARISESQGLESAQGRVSPLHTDVMNMTLRPRGSNFLG